MEPLFLAVLPGGRYALSAVLAVLAVTILAWAFWPRRTDRADPADNQDTLAPADAADVDDTAAEPHGHDAGNEPTEAVAEPPEGASATTRADEPADVEPGRWVYRPGAVPTAPADVEPGRDPAADAAAGAGPVHDAGTPGEAVEEPGTAAPVDDHAAPQPGAGTRKRSGLLARFRDRAQEPEHLSLLEAERTAEESRLARDAEAMRAASLDAASDDAHDEDDTDLVVGASQNAGPDLPEPLPPRLTR